MEMKFQDQGMQNGILVPQQIYFTYPYNLWPLRKYGLKQMDLEVFLYIFDAWQLFSMAAIKMCGIKLIQDHNLLVDS